MLGHLAYDQEKLLVRKQVARHVHSNLALCFDGELDPLVSPALSQLGALGSQWVRRAKTVGEKNHVASHTIDLHNGFVEFFIGECNLARHVGRVKTAGPAATLIGLTPAHIQCTP